MDELIENHSDWTALHRTFAPYAGTVIILSGVTLFCVFVAIQHRQWGLLIGVSVIWSLYAIDVYIGTRYRVLWKEDRVLQIASGMPDVVISMSEIAEIRLERSDLSTALSMRRPFRRIALYTGHSESSRFLDISLKHFVASDIRTLMKAIHQRRPDLVYPVHWI